MLVGAQHAGCMQSAKSVALGAVHVSVGPGDCCMVAYNVWSCPFQAGQHVPTPATRLPGCIHGCERACNTLLDL
jgi:hypothetical protein